MHSMNAIFEIIIFGDGDSSGGRQIFDYGMPGVV